jgi:hypothetical protein
VVTKKAIINIGSRELIVKGDMNVLMNILMNFDISLHDDNCIVLSSKDGSPLKIIPTTLNRKSSYYDIKCGDHGILTFVFHGTKGNLQIKIRKTGSQPKEDDTIFMKQQHAAPSFIQFINEVYKDSLLLAKESLLLAKRNLVNKQKSHQRGGSQHTTSTTPQQITRDAAVATYAIGQMNKDLFVELMHLVSGTPQQTLKKNLEKQIKRR